MAGRWDTIPWASGGRDVAASAQKHIQGFSGLYGEITTFPTSEDNQQCAMV